MYYESELYHHGVDGMRWGKRNGPPYPLDSEGKADLKEQNKKEKAESYRSKEYSKLEKRYNEISDAGEKRIAKREEQYDKAKENGASDKKLAKKESKLYEAYFDTNYEMALKSIEMGKLKGMTVQDLQEEKAAVGKQYIKNAAISIGASATMAVAHVPIVYIQYTNTEKFKSNRRLESVSPSIYIDTYRLASQVSSTELSMYTNEHKKLFKNN